MVVAKLGSPLAIGLSKDEFYIGSDATPFIEYTKKVIYLNDFEMAHLKVGSEIQLTNSKDNKLVKFEVEELDLNLESIQKGVYDHFMLKEIFEQPQAIANALRGRIHKESLEVQLESIQQHETKFLNAKRIIILGCGTSWHARLVGEYMIEKLLEFLQKLNMLLNLDIEILLLIKETSLFLFHNLGKPLIHLLL